MRRKKASGRPGRTKNVSVSLDGAILEMLRAHANARHDGNLSAAIAEAALVLGHHVARDAVASELMKGHPPLTEEDRHAIDAELAEGWAHARRQPKKRKSAA
jgi:hypothetical protein